MQSIALMMSEVGQAIAAVDPATPGHVLYERFAAEPDTLVVAVVDPLGRPVGLVERNAFALKIGGAYGRALYAGRPIAKLMDADPILVEADTPVGEFTSRFLGERAADLLRGFVVVREGVYLGVGHSLGLLFATSREREAQARRLSALAVDLDAARTEAQSAERMLRGVIEAMPEGVAYYDRDDRLVLFNQRYVQLHSRSAAALRPGASLIEVLRHGLAQGQYPDAAGREAQWLSQRLANRDVLAAHDQRLPDGRWVRIEERLLADGGRIGVAVDITELKRHAEAMQEARDAAEASNRAKSEFLANMSHEIRTPMNGVVGVADALAQTELAPPQREMVEIVRSSAAALQALISDILDLARIESGRLTLASEPFDLCQAAREAASLFEQSAKAKGLRLAVEVTEPARVWVRGDVARLKQILLNLLSNAVKFTPEGEVGLRVARPGPADTVVFEVRDTGMGFDDREAERLFGRFQQADGSITRRHGGSGLGLAISRDLAELMGGALTARSRVGAGSCFTLTVPLPSAEAQPQAGARDEPAAPDRTLRVLVADDHPTNRRVVELILASLEVELTSVEDGAQAVEAVSTHGFDCVLMDLQMPVMDGLTAIREIRAAEVAGGRPRTPILALSANAMPEHVAAARAAGADGHLAKPITASALLQGLQTALAQGGTPVQDARAA